MQTFPDVRQAKSYDCSAACAKAVEEHFGVTKPLCHYVNSLSAEATSGCDPRTLGRFFRKAGYGVIEGEMFVPDLQWHTERARPVITPITAGDGHYVVVYRVSRGYVYLQDPWSGPTRVKQTEFLASWRDHDSVETFRQWGIAVHC